MFTRKSYDLAIIGGGIVGLSTAMTVAERFPSLTVVLLEKEDQLAAHQTGHNSGVIHSGIYYKPGSLKAKLSVDGARRMIQFAEENAVPHEICGKMIVATKETELAALQTLWERGEANGLSGLRQLGPEEIREREPHVAGIKGILVPATGIIDFVAAARAMAAQFERAGGDIVTGAKLHGYRAGNPSHLETSAGDVAARYVVNCAGLYSDTIARLMGTEPGATIVPFRGEYHLIRPERRELVRHLVYPVPDPQFPFLGVHFTRTVDGILEAGPNAVLALAREGYSKLSVRPAELFQTLAYPGFRAMALKHWKMGLGEITRSLSKAAFTRALQALVPELTPRDLLPGPRGVRAQCVEANGNLVDDFRIVPAANAIHVLNVPSPAATASLAIAPYIVELMEKQFALA